MRIECPRCGRKVEVNPEKCQTKPKLCPGCKTEIMGKTVSLESLKREKQVKETVRRVENARLRRGFTNREMLERMLFAGMKPLAVHGEQSPFRIDPSKIEMDVEMELEKAKDEGAKVP